MISVALLHLLFFLGQSSYRSYHYYGCVVAYEQDAGKPCGVLAAGGKLCGGIAGEVTAEADPG